MNINIFDSAIIVAAIAGGITGALVAVVVSLGTIRAQRHLGGTTFGAPQPSSEWRVPSGPLARHLAHADAPTQQEQKNEATRPPE
ncbi:MAG: hypothetical protein E6I18_00445 [Chloroflexi bacterium]|nr:MAG: hypothetical protein E6I18_00445 [Chloroflexota bacterium]